MLYCINDREKTKSGGYQMKRKLKISSKKQAGSVGWKNFLHLREPVSQYMHYKVSKNLVSVTKKGALPLLLHSSLI